jgi:hypothetical protein
LTTNGERANEEALTNLSQNGGDSEGFLFLAVKQEETARKDQQMRRAQQLPHNSTNDIQCFLSPGGHWMHFRHRQIR